MTRKQHIKRMAAYYMQTVTYIAQMDMEHELTSLRDNEFLPTAVEEQSLPVS